MIFGHTYPQTTAFTSKNNTTPPLPLPNSNFIGVHLGRYGTVHLRLCAIYTRVLCLAFNHQIIFIYFLCPCRMASVLVSRVTMSCALSHIHFFIYSPHHSVSRATCVTPRPECIYFFICVLATVDDELNISMLTYSYLHFPWLHRCSYPNKEVKQFSS